MVVTHQTFLPVWAAINSGANFPIHAVRGSYTLHHLNFFYATVSPADDVFTSTSILTFTFMCTLRGEGALYP
jgi:hypothetical protein